MPDDEQLLTQEQIDAMLSGSFGGEEEEEAEVTVVAVGENPVKLKPTSMDEIRAKSGKPVMKQAKPASAAAPANNAEIEKLSKRLAKLEAAVKAQSGPCAGHAQMPEDLRTLASKIQAVNQKVDSIITSLQGTVGFGARELCVQGLSVQGPRGGPTELHLLRRRKLVGFVARQLGSLTRNDDCLLRGKDSPDLFRNCERIRRTGT
jgi:hypothetical protein